MFILGIETSCDDTSVAIVDDSGRVVAMCSADQISEHTPFGGVVPEIASRSHLTDILPLIELTLSKAELEMKDIAAVAVTAEPGLLGALLVGVTTAKALCLAHDIPLIAINHLEGHIYAPFLKDDEHEPKFSMESDFIALAVSGGHSSLYKVIGSARKGSEEASGSHPDRAINLLGSTIDDAAGEAFDKLAKMLSLGFPGGVKVDQLAQSGDPNAYEFPRALNEKGNFNFSFSGIKTSALNLIKKLPNSELDGCKADICASYQEAIVDSLISKLGAVMKKEGLSKFVITGGVSANSRLRARTEELAKENNYELIVPPLKYCTDNAAMIALVGLMKFKAGEFADLELSPSPRSTLFVPSVI